jgi:hypothetical protein
MRFNMSRLSKTLNLLQPVTTPYELIRIGENSDGGYVLPNDLEGVTECLSFGFGGIKSFEDSLAQLGIRSHIFDNLSDSKNIIASCSELIKFHHGFLGTLRAAKIPIYRIKDAIREANISSNDIILQMDVESSEYEALLEVDIGTLKRFRIIIVEFHRLNELADSSIFLTLFERLLQKLNSEFFPVHIHGNNAVRPFLVNHLIFPGAVEVTFIRRDRLTNASVKFKTGNIRNAFDRNCNPDKKEIDIYFPVESYKSSKITRLLWYYRTGILWIRSKFRLQRAKQE